MGLNEEQYVFKDNKRMRRGYTTGSCAAAAAQAAAATLLTGKRPEKVILDTPKGIRLELEPEEFTEGEDWVSCAIRKDSGDDPDVTHGALIFAKVSRIPGTEIELDGGEGVGRVTKPGLECPVGAAAINRVPREMIRREVEQVREMEDYRGGLRVVISIPMGVELAKRTFNPRLGITGGISVLGTTGIVEPMSEAALIETIRVEMRVLASNGVKDIVITPGNYGQTFLKERTGLPFEDSVKCSNFIGQTLDYAAELGFESALLVGHIGKFVKLAGGIMNTHSHWADCRLELFAVHAALCGAPVSLLERLMQCVTTDDAILLLDEAGLREQVLARLLERIDFYTKARVGDGMKLGTILFSNRYGMLGQTVDAPALVEKLTAQKRHETDPQAQAAVQ